MCGLESSWLLSFCKLAACIFAVSKIDSQCYLQLSATLCTQVAEQGREDLVYRSGRVRQPNETNGKACNLNNTLHWLYPADKCVSDEEVRLAVAAGKFLHSAHYGTTASLQQQRP